MRGRLRRGAWRPPVGRFGWTVVEAKPKLTLPPTPGPTGPSALARPGLQRAPASAMLNIEGVHLAREVELSGSQHRAIVFPEHRDRVLHIALDVRSCL